jgi:response regulator RpfG family c-di-GMP phosphodiesterase
MASATPTLYGIYFVIVNSMSAKHKNKPAILLLARDSDLAESIRIYLEDSYRVYYLSDIDGLDTCLRKYKIDILLTDLDKSSPGLLKELESVKSEYRRLRIMVMCMFLDDDEGKEQLLLKEADDHIFKPFNASVLKYKLDKLNTHSLAPAQ